LVKQTKDSNLLLIKQAGNDIDKEISSIERMSFQLSLQPKTKSALYSFENDWEDDQILYSDIIKSISSASISTQSVSELWIEVFKSNIVLNRDAKYSSDYYFNNVYRYRNGFDINEIIKKHPKFISLGRQKVYTDSKEKSVITFARGISVDDATPNGMICANVDEEVFKEILSSLSLKNHLNTYVIDFDGNIVLDSGNSLNDSINLVDIRKMLNSQDGYLLYKIDGKEYVVSYSTSKICNWNYISIIPTEIITEKANNIKNITLVAAFLCLIIGICISFLLTRRIYKPISEIISYINAFQTQRKVKEGIVKENELLFINRIINNIYNENKNLIDTFNQNVPVLKEKLLYDVLEGKYNKKDFIEDTARLKMDFPFSNYQVLVLEIEDYSVHNKILKNASNIEKIIDDLALNEYHDDLVTYSLRRANNRIVTIINSSYETESSGKIFEFINKVKDNISTSFNLILTIGVGNTYKNPENAYLSFIDAMSALKYKIVKGQGSIIHIDEIMSLPETIFEYSVETENQLINFIKSGDLNGINASVNEVITRNLKLQKTSLEAVENLYNTLAGTAIRTIYEVRSSVTEIFGYNKNFYKELLELKKIDDKKEYVLNVMFKISNYISSRKLGQGQKILERIDEYIQKNYCNELSLAQVSKCVELSPAYLSSIFKEISGENFVDYVNRVRIEKSKSLLQTNDFTVAQIAEKVGFISSNTFIKVFKKHEGITPGQYRDSKLI
jgi:AraC-type DNA-binding domain-containing proteins